jgi:sulfotransferase
MKKIFFNSSLPRAGSTLIQNILMHNPKIHSTPTSGLSELLLNARTLYSTGDAFRAQNEEEMEKAFKGFCNSALHGYFENITDRPYVIDKSRAWLGHYGFLDWFYEKPKIIVMVRDLRSIFSSMEKNFRKNPHKDPLIVNGSELKNMTTSARVNHFSISPPVGPSIEWLFETIHQGLHENILFIKFEDLTTNPKKEIDKIYRYLELEPFEHDFDNIQQLTHENDIIHGIFGDHKIKNKISPVVEDYNEILGKGEADRIKEHYNWFYQFFNYL